ncbi:hypothetical protein KLNKPBOH_01159 [Aeromonas veronii]
MVHLDLGIHGVFRSWYRLVGNGGGHRTRQCRRLLVATATGLAHADPELLGRLGIDVIQGRHVEAHRGGVRLDDHVAGHRLDITAVGSDMTHHHLDGQIRFRGIADAQGVVGLAPLDHIGIAVQGQGRCILIINHCIGDGASGNNSLVIATTGLVDSDAQRLFTLLINVISTNRYRFAVGTAAHRNGDHHPVGKDHGQRAAGHRIADTGGVDNAAALGHGLAVGGRAQGHGGSVDSVDHVGGHRATGIQLFVVATLAAGDAHRQAAAIQVHIVDRGIDRHATVQLARLDGDVGPIG